MSKIHRPGDVHHHDFQADVFEGEYVLVADLGDGTWEIEYLEPSDAVLDRIEQAYLHENYYLGVHDPWGPERRLRDRSDPADVDEAMMEEIEDRIEQAGTRSKIRFVSAAAYAELF